MQTDNHNCFSCKHFRSFRGGCDAFPDGIPMEISDEGDPHTTRMEGQGNDIVYEKKAPGEPDADGELSDVVIF